MSEINKLARACEMDYDDDQLTSFCIAYQKFTNATNVNKPESKYAYIVANLASEAGEVAGLYAKELRDNTPNDVYEANLKKELGDIMWHVSELCNEHCWSIEDIMLDNVKKLEDRHNRNKIKGSGDDR